MNVVLNLKITFTFLGTVQPFEAYIVGCSATDQQDYVILFGFCFCTSCIAIFVATNILISIHLDNFRQLFTLPSCSMVTTVAIGIFGAFGIVLGILTTRYVDKPENAPHVAVSIFSIVLLGVLVLYIVKDHSSTFPFIRGQLEKALRFLSCRQTPVVPFAEPTGEEFNPRHLQISRISGGNVLRIPDDGGIYMGPSLPNVVCY